jgi:O-antigen/teichoic acid export membrane protein
MRTKRLLRNTFFNLLEVLVTIICGMIVPRMILNNYGSAYYGVSSAITQFLSVAFLLRAGIGGAVKAALYKPIANNDTEKMSAIANASNHHMRRVCAFLSGFVVLMSIGYPFFVIKEFEWGYTFLLFIIMSISVFSENFFGITYICILEADQKSWIYSGLRSVCAVANTIMACILITLKFDFCLVKGATTIIYGTYPIVIFNYVYKHYGLDKMVKPDFSALAQRWDAFWNQTAEYVNNNTDIVLLTIFSNVYEVSVYSLYNLIIGSVKRLVGTLTYSLESAFGSMLAESEHNRLDRTLGIVETMVFSLGTVIYTATGLLIFDFVAIYTRGVEDANYYRPAFGLIMILACFLYGVRTIYDALIRAAGHFKQTKKIVISEAIINLLISLALVNKLGMIGVAIGTFLASMCRAYFCARYIDHELLKKKNYRFWFKMLVSVIEGGIVVGIFILLNVQGQTDWLHWVIKAVITTFTAGAVVLLIDLLFFRDDIRAILRKLTNAMR